MYQLDAEPYGGATIHALERTDYTQLEHLEVVGGKYRVLVTNEMDEVQHTNSLHLVIADHRPGTDAVVDVEGSYHAFHETEPPLSATDEQGTDLLRWLAESDRALWYSDLERFAGRAPLADTRNHLTLEFTRPKTSGSVYLIADGGTGTWGAHFVRSMLEMCGPTAWMFYAAINVSKTNRRSLRRAGPAHRRDRGRQALHHGRY